MYWNYKQRDSIVLLAVCDAVYKLILVYVGQPGSNSDGGIWDGSEFGRGLEIGKYNIDYFLICGRPVVFQLDRLSWIVLVII